MYLVAFDEKGSSDERLRSTFVIEYHQAMVKNLSFVGCFRGFNPIGFVPNLVMALRFVAVSAVVWVGVTVTNPNESRAQSGSSHGDDVSLFLGHMLPSQIEGVREILPVFGGRYGIGTNFGAVDIGLQNSHAMGVDFTTLTVDLRGEFPIASGLHGLLYAGPVLNYYTRQNTEDRLTEYGLEAGTGAMMLVSDTLWLRADLKYMGGPGSSLYFLFGAAFRLGAGNP